jgi:hypothetical protein
MTTESLVTREQGEGWVSFAGVMILILGVVNVIWPAAPTGAAPARDARPSNEAARPSLAARFGTDQASDTELPPRKRCRHRRAECARPNGRECDATRAAQSTKVR